MKKVHKYATGDEIPDGAQYLGTVSQTEQELDVPLQIRDDEPKNIKTWKKCWLVWHYFLVEE